MAKVKNILGIFVAAHLVNAHQHLGGSAHAHRRIHQHHVREPATALVEVVPGPTVVVYEFDGHSVSVKDVCEGIKNGTFEWTPGSDDAPDCGPYGFTLVQATATPAPAATNEQVSSVTSTLSAATSSDTGMSQGSQSQDGDNLSGLTGLDMKIAQNPNVNKEFPDGQLDCSEFPSAYGAIPIEWIGLHGWSGIQYTSMNDNSVTHIDTGVKGNDCANPGTGAVAYCSYACPPGYQKSQWPSTQGSANMAVSVGGLMCGTDGKLHLTNPGLSKKLCIPGTDQVNVKNELSEKNSICRTDYPGTEDMVVPLVVQKGATSPLTCPNSATYYKHLGAPTTAQYYVNMKGIPVNKACEWSTDGSHMGNWAPLVFGVGMDQYGKTWLSIQSTIQNQPANYTELDFNVDLQGDFGGAKCFYKNGHYCTQGDPDNVDYSQCQTIHTTEVPGCTVQLMSGNATYVLTD